jgi:hypothetical protein
MQPMQRAADATHPLDQICTRGLLLVLLLLSVLLVLVLLLVLTGMRLLKSAVLQRAWR